MPPRTAQKRLQSSPFPNKTKLASKRDQEIHTGLTVDDSIIEFLPEELQTFLKECSFSRAIVALLHCSEYSWQSTDGGVTSSDVKSKYNILCRPENRENIICRGYWKKGEALILNITHKSKHYELILNGCKNERPMVIKRHIREGKYGKPVSFENKIHLPYQPYIFRRVSGMEISK